MRGQSQLVETVVRSICSFCNDPTYSAVVAHLFWFYWLQCVVFVYVSPKCIGAITFMPTLWPVHLLGSPWQFFCVSYLCLSSSFFPFLKLNAISQSLENWEFFIHGNKRYTGSHSANYAIIFHLKSPYQVLELRGCSNVHNMFHRISGRCPSHWIVTSPHYVEKGTSRAMRSLWRLSCNWE